MPIPKIKTVYSYHNPWFKQLQKLAFYNDTYRKQNRVWLEGEHLCQSYYKQYGPPEALVYTDTYVKTLQAWFVDGHQVDRYQISRRLMQNISSLKKAEDVGFIIKLPTVKPIQPKVQTLILDRIQDAGNVGSILRTAAAFGIKQVLAIQGTALFWSAKVLRAAMGAHFSLRLTEGLAPDALQLLEIPLVVTHAHQGQYLHKTYLPYPNAWIFGHEGQGVSHTLQSMADLQIRIPQSTQESLNVTAAVAICLYTHAIHNMVV